MPSARRARRRIIISTFTFVQSPYAVHADMGGDAAAMRDACRYHFGFTVPLMVEDSTAAVVAAVARAHNDLGLVRCDGGDSAAPWWESLRDSDAPKVIARLPFVERADHAAGLPLLVIARPIRDAVPAEVALYAATCHECADLPSPFDSVARAGRSILVAAPGAMPAEAVAAELGDAVPIGSHAAPFALAPQAARRNINPRSPDR